MSDMAELTIGEVARRAGVATSLIRYCESIGLLPEPDRLYGQRRYDTDVLGRLAFIGVAQSAGFKLTEINGIEDGNGLSNRIRSLSVASSTTSRRCSSALGPGRDGSRSRSAADAQRQRNARSSLSRATT